MCILRTCQCRVAIAVTSINLNHIVITLDPSNWPTKDLYRACRRSYPNVPSSYNKVVMNNCWPYIHNSCIFFIFIFTNTDFLFCFDKARNSIKADEAWTNYIKSSNKTKNPQNNRDVGSLIHSESRNRHAQSIPRGWGNPPLSGVLR